MFQSGAPARTSQLPSGLYVPSRDPLTLAFRKRVSTKMTPLAEAKLDDILRVKRLNRISLDFCYVFPFCGSLADAALNVIGPSFPITWYGTPTLNLGQSVSLDGVSQYGDTGINLATYGGAYTLNSCFLALLIINPMAGNSFEFGSRQSGTGGTFYAMIRALNSGSKPGFYGNNSNQEQWPYKIGAGPTMLAYSRQAANPGTILAMVNSQILPIAAAAEAVPNANLLVGKGGTALSPDAFGILMGGGELSAAQMVALSKPCENSLITIGAISSGLGTGSVAMSDSDPLTPLNPGLLSYVTPAAFTSPTSGGNIVQRNSPPPPDNNQTAATFNAFPGNQYVYSLGNFAQGLPTTSWTGGNLVLQLWAPGAVNRRNGKANPSAPNLFINGVSCRTTFSTVSTAIAALTAIGGIQMGLNAHSDSADPLGQGFLDVMAAAGLPTDDSMATGSVISYANASTNPATYFSGYSGSFRVSLDLIVAPPAVFANMPSNGYKLMYQLDYEANEPSRTTAQTRAVLTRLATMAHNKNFLFSFWADPIGAQNVSGLFNNNSGDQANLQAIYSAVDYWGLMVLPNQPQGARAQIDAQVSVVFPNNTGGPYPKFMIYYGEGGSGSGRMTIADAAAINAAIVYYGMGGTMEFPNGAAMGSSGSAAIVRAVNGVPANAVGATGGGATGGSSGSSDGSAGTGGGAPTFQPTDLGNLLDFWTTASGITGSSTVSKWTGANGTALAQATASKQPSIVSVGDGSIVLSADGIDDFLQAAGMPAGYMSTQGELHMLVYLGATGAARALTSIGNSGALTLTRAANGSLGLTGGATAPTTPAVGYHVVSVRWTSTGRYISFDAGTEGSSATGITPTGTLTFFANNAPGNFANAKVKDIIMTLPSTASQFQKIQGWLAWDGGIQGNLPTSHPYYSVRP